MTPEIFESVRLLTIIVAVLLRMILMPIYLQAYLNLAYDRIEEQKKEAGRITNTEYKQVNNFHFHQIFTHINFLTFFFFVTENNIDILLLVCCDIAIFSTNSHVFVPFIYVQVSWRIFVVMGIEAFCR